MNYMKILKMILDLMFQKSIGTLQVKMSLTLDKIEGISIRENEQLKKDRSEYNINYQEILFNIF